MGLSADAANNLCSLNKLFRKTACALIQHQRVLLQPTMLPARLPMCLIVMFLEHTHTLPRGVMTTPACHTWALRAFSLPAATSCTLSAFNSRSCCCCWPRSASNSALCCFRAAPAAALAACSAALAAAAAPAAVDISCRSLSMRCCRARASSCLADSCHLQCTTRHPRALFTGHGAQCFPHECCLCTFAHSFRLFKSQKRSLCSGLARHQIACCHGRQGAHDVVSRAFNHWVNQSTVQKSTVPVATPTPLRSPPVKGCRVA